MVIGIDGNEANLKDKVGVHQFAYELFHSFYKLASSTKEDIKFKIFLKDAPREDLPKENNNWEYKILPGKNLWIIKNLMPELGKDKKIDVFYSPNHYLPVFSKVPMICTIHDLGYLNFSGQFKKSDFWQLKYWTAISIFISKYIIAVSESTKKDIVRHYPFASKKIEVTYHGYDSERFNLTFQEKDVRRIKEKYRISKNYILFLSTLKPSKNIEGLLEAFSKVSDNLKKDYSLVIAGKKGWLYDSIFSKVKDLNLSEKVIFTDFVEEQEKEALIHGAKFLVSPSFWEGFGMHVLESMACGTLVVVSNVASLPEVAGKSGIYVNPNNIESIKEGMEKVLKMNPIEYNKLKEEVSKEAKNFSWQKTASETLSIIKKGANVI